MKKILLTLMIYLVSLPSQAQQTDSFKASMSIKNFTYRTGNFLWSVTQEGSDSEIILLCNSDGITTRCTNTAITSTTSNPWLPPFVLTSTGQSDWAGSGKYTIKYVEAAYSNDNRIPSTISFSDITIKTSNGGGTTCSIYSSSSNYGFNLTKDISDTSTIGKQQFIVNSYQGSSLGCDEFRKGNGTATITLQRLGSVIPSVSELIVDNNPNDGGACKLQLSMEAPHNTSCKITLGGQSSITVDIGKKKKFPIEYSGGSCASATLLLHFETQNGVSVLVKNGNVWSVSGQNGTSDCMQKVTTDISGGDTLNVNNK